MPDTINWGGTHSFRINGAAIHEDTLRIRSSTQKQERIFKLVLPTLCITYADMKFQNEVGGEQKNYPDSQSYGPLYFDPPVVIDGDDDIERMTYIRGARKVTIGPRETFVEFRSWKELVIPRLRIEKKKPLEGKLEISAGPITIAEPLRVDVRQFADGRHVGGIRIEKRHPGWKPPKVVPTYDLGIHVLDGLTGRSLPRMRVDILHWDKKLRIPYGEGGFQLDDSPLTNASGGIRIMGRPSGELEAFVVRVPGRRSVVRCIRPLAAQKVQLHLCSWPLQRDLRPYIWQQHDSIESIVELCGCSPSQFLEANHLAPDDKIESGCRVILPCWAAVYRLEPLDTLEWLAKSFGFKSAEALAKVNETDLQTITSISMDIKLPGWHFFYAREGDTLDSLDRMFQLPKGSVIMVGRCYHVWDRLPFVGEVVAVPRR